MKKLIAFLMLIVAGCSAIPPANLPSDEEKAVEVFKYCWKKVGLPSLDKCHIDDTRVLHTTSDNEFIRECHGIRPEKAASCLSQRVYGRFGVPVVVLRPMQPAIDSFGGGPIVHELCHSAGVCVGLGDTGLDSEDQGHKDTRRFLVASKDPAVRAASVQGCAQELLK